jgi:hypothetical protein
VVPASKKFELLEFVVWGDNSGGIVYALLATINGRTIIPDEMDSTPAGRYSWRSSWNALAFNDGDDLTIVGTGGAGSYAWACTYMDVDTD